MDCPFIEELKLFFDLILRLSLLERQDEEEDDDETEERLSWAEFRRTNSKMISPETKSILLVQHENNTTQLNPDTWPDSSFVSFRVFHDILDIKRYLVSLAIDSNVELTILKATQVNAENFNQRFVLLIFLNR